MLTHSVAVCLTSEATKTVRALVKFVLRAVAVLPYRELNEGLQSRPKDIILPFFSFYGLYPYL